MYTIERLSRGESAIHRLHPACKSLVTLVFLAAVLSFGRYELARLLPYAFYPAVGMALSDTPYGPVLKRASLALPFALLAGAANVFLERQTALRLLSVPVSYGMLSLLSLTLKTYLCVVAVLMLSATTPASRIAESMRLAHVPQIFVTVFTMTYRYIGTLLEEAHSLYTAYLLRHARARGVEMRHMGSLSGSLLLRSMARAERVYAAMQLRGYPGGGKGARQKAKAGDWAFLLLAGGFCIFLRAVDVPTLLGGILGAMT